MMKTKCLVIHIYMLVILLNEMYQINRSAFFIRSGDVQLTIQLIKLKSFYTLKYVFVANSELQPQPMVIYFLLHRLFG
jgi:hypothetical protein